MTRRGGGQAVRVWPLEALREVVDQSPGFGAGVLTFLMGTLMGSWMDIKELLVMLPLTGSYLQVLRAVLVQFHVWQERFLKGKTKFRDLPYLYMHIAPFSYTADCKPCSSLAQR